MSRIFGRLNGLHINVQGVANLFAGVADFSARCNELNFQPIEWGGI